MCIRDRYYLQEGPILPTVRTYWLGDLDQLEMVIENIEDYHIRPISASNLGGAMPAATDEIARAVRKHPGAYIAQPIEGNGEPRTELEQDHIVFALRRREEHYEAVSYTHLDVYKRQAPIIRPLTGSGPAWKSRPGAAPTA